MDGKLVNRLVSELKNCCLGNLQRKSCHVSLIGQEFVYVCAWKTSKNYFHSLEETPFYCREVCIHRCNVFTTSFSQTDDCLKSFTNLSRMKENEAQKPSQPNPQIQINSQR